MYDIARREVLTLVKNEMWPKKKTKKNDIENIDVGGEQFSSLNSDASFAHARGGHIVMFYHIVQQVFAHACIRTVSEALLGGPAHT